MALTSLVLLVASQLPLRAQSEATGLWPVQEIICRHNCTAVVHLQALYQRQSSQNVQRTVTP